LVARRAAGSFPFRVALRLESALHQEDNGWRESGGGQTMSGSMTIDVVDESDQPIGTIARDAVLGSGQAFRTAHVFLLNQADELLLQQLSAARPRHAGRWGSSVAAYLHAGESYMAAATRRLGEELGLHGAALREAGKLVMPEDGARKFVTLFVAKHSGPVQPEPAVIAEVRWVARETIARELDQHPDHFTPTFTMLFEHYNRGG
jgi:isopentenyl-diphosphate delta-isomerase